MDAPNLTHHAAEYRTILSMLKGIRARLYLTRLLERGTLALVVAGLLALDLLFGAFLLYRYPILGHLVLVLPLMAAPAAIWARFGRKVPVLALGLGIATVLVTAAYLVLVHTTLRPLVGSWMVPTASAAACFAAALATTRPVDTRATAIFVDHQVGLKERVSTALEWAHVQPGTSVEAAFGEPLVQSALEACKTVHGAKVGYARLDGRSYALAATCVIAALAATRLEPLASLYHPIARPNLLVMQTGKSLARQLEEIEKEKPIKVDPLTGKTPGEQLRPIVTELKRGDMTPLEAMAELNKAKDEMKEITDKQDAGQNAEKALANSQSEAANRLAEAAQKLADAQAKAAQGESGAGAAMEAAGKELADAAKAAGDKLASGQMSDKEKKDLTSALGDASSKAGGDAQLKDALDRAGSAANSGNGKDLASGLQDAGNQMGKDGASRTLSGEELKQAMKAADSAAESLGGNSAQANSGNKDGQSGEQGNPNGGQQNPDGSSQANAGGEKSGGQQQPGGGGQQQPGGGGQQQPGGGGEQQPGGGGEQQAGGKQPGEKGGTGAQPGGDQTASTGGPGGMQGPREPGNGSTNLEQKGAPGSKDQDGTVGRSGMMVKLYDATAIANRGDAHQADITISKGPSAGVSEVMGLADRNATTVDYNSQLPSAGKIAEDAMNKQQIPPQYRDVIRNFYDEKSPH